MACRPFGAKPLSESMMTYCQLDPKEHISMKYYLKFKIFIQENARENIVCEMAAILSRPQYANTYSAIHLLSHNTDIVIFYWGHDWPFVTNIKRVPIYSV